jgi:hypothetical protein
MKVIGLGLQCSVPDGIMYANRRDKSYPFDWLWCPSKTTYHVLHRLIHEGVDSAIEYMTTGYTYYVYLQNEHYESVDEVTECQMNKETGLGNTHFTINEEYKATLRRRLTRLAHVMYHEPVLFIYADAASPSTNYHLDNVEYGVDATEYLIKIHRLLSPLNSHFHIIYFCWTERKKENNLLEYVPFDHQPHFSYVSEIIAHYLLNKSI